MFLIPKTSYSIQRTNHKGRGAFATRDIGAGTIIGDYLGTVMRPEDEDEEDGGLYTIEGGKYYDILANPKKEGIHLINHSCASNCVIYPYQGHMLYVAARKIFKDDEITVDYWLGRPDGDTVTCTKHACHCGSRLCTGTMHNNTLNIGAWYSLVKKQFGGQFNRVPVPYGKVTPPLKYYSRSIMLNRLFYKDIFGTETKSPLRYKDNSLPALIELRKRIRSTGRCLYFPKLHIAVDGIRNNEVLVRRT